MATFTDLSELNDYEIPASGETIKINIAENYYGSYVLNGLNIVSFNAEDGNNVGEVVIEDDIFRFYNLNGEGESVTITFEVGQNTEPSFVSFSIAFYDTVGEPVGNYNFLQAEGEPPSPTWGDGQHKIYRSGHQVKKMYRSGEVIYLRLNPSNQQPQPEPPTPPVPTYQWVEITADFDRSIPFTKVRWDFSKSWYDGYFSELPNINCDNKGWTSIRDAEWGYAGQYTMNLQAKKCYIRNQSTDSYDLYDMYAITTQVDTNLYEYEYSVPLYWGGVSSSSLYDNGLGLYVYVEVNPTNE